MQTKFRKRILHSGRPMHISNTCLLIVRELFTHWDRSPCTVGSLMAISEDMTALEGMPSSLPEFLSFVFPYQFMWLAPLC